MAAHALMHLSKAAARSKPQTRIAAVTNAHLAGSTEGLARVLLELATCCPPQAGLNVPALCLWAVTEFVHVTNHFHQASEPFGWVAGLNKPRHLLLKTLRMPGVVEAAEEMKGS